MRNIVGGPEQIGGTHLSERTDIETFVARARAWLTANAKPVEPAAGGQRWGVGSDAVPVFYDLVDDDEAALLQAIMAWQRQKFDAGYGALTWPVEYGGAGLAADYALAFAAEEAAYQTPGRHETFSVTLNLVAPTIRAFGSPEQRRELIPQFLRTSELCCQLFSEPGAGSDLAGLATRAVRDGDEWVINGQKVWSSGARFAKYGELICRTDPDVPKHAGQTAFIVPMELPGITIVPIRQMTGGASFNEVFFDDVRVPDSARLGDVGQGWKVALTTLGYERTSSGTRGSHEVGGSWEQVLALAQWLDATSDPLVRQQLAELYMRQRVREWLTARSLASRRAGAEPGPEGSIGKLIWTQWLARVGEVAGTLLGPRLTADTGEWGTFAWTKHVLGAPGYRIAGGSDEIQRNIIGERVLGLPGEPRVDRDVAFNAVPR